MKYFYDCKIAESVINFRKYRALTDDEVKHIPLYPANDFLVEGWNAGLNMDIEPLSYFDGPSFSFGEFDNKEEAYRELCFNLNRDIAETIFDC